MFESVKSFCNIPATIKRFAKRDGAGDKIYDKEKGTLVYPVGEVTLVKNKEGVEVVSNSHFYIDGSESITALDVLIFEGKEHEVITVTTYYSNGKPDIKVVYV